MKKTISAMVVTMILCLLLTGCSCKHEWADATCTQPKTCTKCGVTEGDALGHSWGDWEIEKEATVTKSGTKIKTCSRCGETQTESYETEIFFADGYFLLSPKDFCERLSQKLYCQKADLREGDGQMVAGITGVGGFDSSYEDGEAIAAITFSDGERVLGTSDEDSCTINMLGVKFFTNDEKKIAKTMMGIIETCDGSVDTAEAGIIGKKIIRAYQEGTAYRDDSGIAYGLTRQLSKSGNYMFIVRLT